MTRFAVFGDTGDGKTLYCVDIIRDLVEDGYIIWSNIHLQKMKYEYIDSTAFVDEVDPREKNCVLVDEVGEISTGHYQYTFNSLISQSRKSIGENQVFLMTTQTQNQASMTLKGMVDFYVFPTILERDEADKRPILMEVDYYLKDKRSIPLTFSDCNDIMPTNLRFRYVFDSCDFYKTGEMVEGMADGRFYKYLYRFEDYVGTKGTIRELKDIINEKYNVSLAEAERNARKIINAKKWDLWEGYMIWKKRMEEKEI